MLSFFSSVRKEYSEPTQDNIADSRESDPRPRKRGIRLVSELKRLLNLR